MQFTGNIGNLVPKKENLMQITTKISEVKTKKLELTANGHPTYCNSSKVAKEPKIARNLPKIIGDH